MRYNLDLKPLGPCKSEPLKKLKKQPFSIVKSITFDSFDAKAIVTKKVAKKRNVRIEFLSCNFYESES